MAPSCSGPVSTRRLTSIAASGRLTPSRFTWRPRWNTTSSARRPLGASGPAACGCRLAGDSACGGSRRRGAAWQRPLSMHGAAGASSVGTVTTAHGSRPAAAPGSSQEEAPAGQPSFGAHLAPRARPPQSTTGASTGRDAAAEAGRGWAAAPRVGAAAGRSTLHTAPAPAAASCWGQAGGAARGSCVAEAAHSEAFSPAGRRLALQLLGRQSAIPKHSCGTTHVPEASLATEPPAYGARQMSPRHRAERL